MKRKAITPEELDKVYKACLERERKREYKWRHTKQGGFESAFVSYDAILDDPDGATDKLRCAGTLGAVISEPDADGLTVKDRDKLKAACTKLRRKKKKHLVRTLRLIAKNDTNREDSICQMMIDWLKRTAQRNGSTTGTGTSSATSSASKRTKRKNGKRVRKL